MEAPTYVEPVFPPPPAPRPPRDRVWLHVVLFGLTLFSTITVWAVWSGKIPEVTSLGELAGKLFSQPHLTEAVLFAGTLLGFLTVHEFGHYFAARQHRVSASLPYFIPLPMLGIGTLGAVIRIREPISSLKKLFDIGVAGPLAGFAFAVVALVIGLATLPGPEIVQDFGPGHEALKTYVAETGVYPDSPLEVRSEASPGSPVIGQTLLFWTISSLFPNVPPMFEIYHFPVVFGAWLGLFFTALNLLPVGQLDGGHIVYGLFGARAHRWIARSFLIILLWSGMLGFLTEPVMADFREMLGPFIWLVVAVVLYGYLYRAMNRDHRLVAPTLGVVLIALVGSLRIGEVAEHAGYSWWLLWSLLLLFLIRVDHPPVADVTPISPGRRAVGILAIVMFVLCFSLRPLYTV